MPSVKLRKKKTDRTYDRVNFCKYCFQLVTNSTRHIIKHHPNEADVVKYLSLKEEDGQIKVMTKKELLVASPQSILQNNCNKDLKKAYMKKKTGNYR